MEKFSTAELADFLAKSPTAFHSVNNIEKILKNEGFIELQESKDWALLPGGKYYCTRNKSSIIAFEIAGRTDSLSFRIAASHSDSPAFRVKEKAEIVVREKYSKLNTEGYGGMIMSTWLDRPLSLAGRVVIKDGDRVVSKLICFDRDLMLIPSLAIHMDRKQNEGHTFNKQVDMLPLIGDGNFKEGELDRLVAKELGIEESDILSKDLFLYNRTTPSVWGANSEFFSGPHLDDLQCAFGSLKGFVKSSPVSGVNVFACFDNEEVGSGTKQGAESTFLADVLYRISESLGFSKEDYLRALTSSMMLSCDNAHAVHPNFPDKTDASNCVYLNEGLVVKIHADQKYTSDGVSIALFKTICNKAQVPLQYFANRSDAPGGSTLGNLAMKQVSLNAVDIGLPQLSMHSSYETAGVKDTEYLIVACEAFYNSEIICEGDGTYFIK